MRYVPRHAAATSRPHASLVLAAIALVAGCAGPMEKLNVDVHGVGSNITLGAQNEAVAKVALPPAMLPLSPTSPNLPPPVLQPSTKPGVLPQPPSGPCPEPPPLQIPALEAGSDATKPPVPATYHYRAKGSWTVGSQKSTYPSDITVTIANITRHTVPSPSTNTPGSDFFEFDVATKVRTVVTIAHYRIVPAAGNPAYQQVPPVQPGQVFGTPGAPTQPPSPAPQVQPTIPNLPYVAVGAPAQPGVYLVSVSNGGAPTVYNGDSGMLLATLPMTEGNGFQSTATAGSQQVEYAAVVGKRARVNACGTYLDSWTIHLTGTVTQANADEGPSVAVDDVYQFAPQFGGLMLESAEKTTSSSGNTVQVAKTVTMTINSVPTTK